MARKALDPSSTYMRRFGMRLRLRRLDCGFETYEKFADSIGLLSETYRLYEVGLRTPKLHVLALISKKLDISLDYLILGRGGTAASDDVRAE